MDTTRYRRRPAEVDAIQWTGDNATQLTAFAGTRFAETAPEDRTDNPDATAALLETEHESWFDLEPGDWVVRRSGVFEALGPEEFADLYEPAVSPVDGQAGR